MRLRLTRPAAQQLDRVLASIHQHNPQGTRSVQRRIREVMHMLLRYPYAGHTVSWPGIRRLVVSPYP